SRSRAFSIRARGASRRGGLAKRAHLHRYRHASTSSKTLGSGYHRLSDKRIAHGDARRTRASARLGRRLRWPGIRPDVPALREPCDDRAPRSANIAARRRGRRPRIAEGGGKRGKRISAEFQFSPSREAAATNCFDARGSRPKRDNHGLSSPRRDWSPAEYG